MTDPEGQTDNRQATSLEQQMEALTAIVEKLESPDVPLEESLALYEQGMQLVAQAGQSLDAAEQRVAMITETGEVQDFEP